MLSDLAQKYQGLFSNLAEGEVLTVRRYGFVERKDTGYEILAHLVDNKTTNCFPGLVLMEQAMRNIITPLLEGLTGWRLVLKRIFDQRGRPLNVSSLNDLTCRNTQQSVASLEFEVVVIERNYDDPAYQMQHIADLRFPLKFSGVDFPVRARKCFSWRNFRTIADLVQITEKDLLKTRNFGEITLKIVKARLQERGLRLGMVLAPEVLALLKDPPVVAQP